MGLKRKRERERESNRSVSRIRRFAIAMCAVALAVPMFAVPVQAASPRAAVDRSGVYNVKGYEYFVEPTAMKLQNAQISTTGGSYRHGTLYYDSSQRVYLRGGDLRNGSYPDKITVRFPNSVSAYDGRKYDFIVEVDNMYTQINLGNYPGWHTRDMIAFLQNGDGFQVNAGANDNPRWHRVGARYDVTMRVVHAGTNTPAQGEVLVGMLDLDLPNLWGNYSGGQGSFTESITILSGLVGSTHVEPNTVLGVSADGLQYWATQKADPGAAVTPERAGVSFLGNASGVKVRWAGTSCSTSLTLKMQGKFNSYSMKTYVQYQQKDGSWGSPQQVDSRSVYSGGSYAYTFTRSADAVYGVPEGADANGSITVRKDNIVSNGSVTIRVPRKQYTYSFNANKPNGEAVSNMPSSVTRYAENTAEPLKVPISTNYTFSGWNTAANGDGAWYTQNESMLSNKTFYAQWVPKTYTLTYVKNTPSGSTGGDSNVTLSKSSQTAKYNSPWGALASASKPGYDFLGWYTAASGGTKISSDTIVKGNLTVYAHWAPVEYTIRFNGNGDMHGCDVTGSMASIKVKYDQMVNLPANKFKATVTVPAEDDGGETVVKPSVFKGWNQNPGSLKSSLADKASVMNLTSKGGAVVDLYAVWDNAPMFVVEQYPDRYFTLEEAHNGVITEEELLKTVIVKDRETNPLPHKTTQQVESGDDVGVSIVGWDASEFTDMTDDGVVSVRYKVKDESGNEAYLNIEVYITGNGPLPRESYDFYRAISEEYKGTLPDDSRWLNDYAYQQLLEDAFSGESKTHSYSIDGSTLEEIRDYIDAHGMGNSGDADALNGLLGSFRD